MTRHQKSRFNLETELETKENENIIFTFQSICWHQNHQNVFVSNHSLYSKIKHLDLCKLVMLLATSNQNGSNLCKLVRRSVWEIKWIFVWAIQRPWTGWPECCSQSCKMSIESRLKNAKLVLTRKMIDFVESGHTDHR